jgi:ribosomal protein S18 acetylase RimI-like enzyme
MSERTDAMAIELIRATPEHAQAIGRIFFEAFDQLARRHGFTPDVFSTDFAQGAAASMTSRPDMYGIVAIENRTVIGHNFVQLSDAVAGIGPIAIDPSHQSRGLGRRMMEHVIDYCLKHHGPQVRLYQEGYNMVSLSLYTELGFDVTDPVVLMSVPPGEDKRVRKLTIADVEEADALCVATQKVSRKNELRNVIENGHAFACYPHGRFANGRLTGFVVPGFFGFAAGETPEDVISTARVAVASFAPPLQRIVIPTRNGDLYRLALREGYRSIKLGQMMAMGPFTAPSGHWCPSVAY